jgi:hypothetical protein
MPGRVYSAVFEGVSVTAVQDFFELTAPSTASVMVHEVHITQDDNETSQQLPVKLIRVPATVTSGTGGTSPTPRKMESGSPAAAATVEANNVTTQATTSGTLEVLRRIGDNVLNGWHWVFLPETRLWLAPSGVLVVRLATAPAAALLMSGEIVWEEVG